MPIVIFLLWIAGVLQIAIAGANFFLAEKLNYRDNLSRVTPIIRQIFMVHSGYIVGVVLLFAAISLGFSRELASGRGLGRFLAAAMAVFWLCRAPVQLIYYDRALRRSHRVGDVALVASALFLAGAYGAAALVLPT